MTDVILDADGRRRHTSRAAFRLLRRYAGGCWGWYGVFATATVAGYAARLVQPTVLAAAVDAIAVERGFEGIVATFAGLMVVATVADLVSGPAEHRFSGMVSARSTHALAERALQLGLPGRRPFDSGDLLSRVAGDAASVAGYPMFLMTVVTSTVAAVVGVAAMAMIDWVLLVPFFGVVLLMGGLGATFFKQTFSGERELRELSTQMSQRFIDALGGRRSIRASRTLGQEVHRITQPLSGICSMGRSLAAVYGKAAGLIFGGQVGIVFAVLGVAGWSLGAGRISAGEVVAAMQYGALAFGSAFRIFDYGWFELAVIHARACRVAEVLDAPLATPDLDDPEALHEAAGQVGFDDVTVLGQADCVLEGLTATVSSGSTVAVVGASGAGKSTIASLAGRLFDPDAGTVRLDGIDVRRLTRADLSTMVAYAFERPALLGATVRGSIAFGTDATDDEVRAAARVADAESWIEHLTDGYDTPLREAPMSGGERQRLGLARAALRRPQVLVLDDALSSLDTATEAKVFEAFRTLAAGRTTIVVAHRASTAARADFVAWLVAGGICRTAPHRELWEDADYRAVFANDGDRSPSPGHAAA